MTFPQRNAAEKPRQNTGNYSNKFEWEGRAAQHREGVDTESAVVDRKDSRKRFFFYGNTASFARKLSRCQDVVVATSTRGYRLRNYLIGGASTVLPLPPGAPPFCFCAHLALLSLRFGSPSSLWPPQKNIITSFSSMRSGVIRCLLLSAICQVVEPALLFCPLFPSACARYACVSGAPLNDLSTASRHAEVGSPWQWAIGFSPC